MSMTIVLGWGMGNRLRSLVSGIILAPYLKEYTKSEQFNVDVLWTSIDIGLTTTFHDLINFEYLEKFLAERDISFTVTDVHEVPIGSTDDMFARYRMQEVKTIHPWHTIPGAPTIDCTIGIDKNFFEEPQVLLDGVIIDPGFIYLDYLSFRVEEHISEEEYLNLKYELYRGILPDSIQEKVNEETASFVEGTVGVHLRGTDRAVRLNCFPSISEWTDFMDAAIEKDPNANFYVCSDEAEKLERLRGLYGERILNPFNGVFYERTSLEGQINAMVEMFSLGNTRSIIGTDQSTFTYEAVHISSSIHRCSTELVMVMNRAPKK